MTRVAFFEKFELVGDAPNAIAKMRELILQLGVHGQLTSNTNAWDPVRLGDVLRLRRGYDLPTQLRRQGSVPIYAANGPVGFHDTPAVMGPGVVTGRSGSIGKVHYVQGDFWPLNTALYVEDFFGNDPAYAVLLLRSLHLERFSTSTAVPTLNRNVVHKEQVRIPPLAEQKRIVAKVDELMALCDRLEAQQKERETRHAALARASLARFTDAPTPANLTFLFHKSYTIPPADLRKSILTLAVQGKLVPQEPHDESGDVLIARMNQGRAQLASAQGVRLPKNVPPVAAEDHPHDIPDSWRWSRLGHLALMIDYGTSQKTDGDASQVPVYRMGNIVRGRLVDDHLKYVRSSIDDLPALYLKTNDILFNRTNSYELVGKVGIFTGPNDVATFASYLIRIRLPSTLLSPAFYALAMNAPYFRQTQIEPEIVQQCGQANFNGTKLGSTVVPVPPFAEQCRIVAKVDGLMALVDELETQLAASRTTATKLLDAIVSELTV